MAEGVPLRGVVAQYLHLHSGKEPLLDQFLVLAYGLCQQAADEGAAKDGGRA